MNKKIFLILGCLLIVPSVTSAYYSAEEFRVDIMNIIRSDVQKQELEDLKNKSNGDIKQELDNYYKTLDTLDKEYEYKMKELELKEAVAKKEKDEQRDLLYKTELDKALAKQKKEFEDGAEERANARAKEYCINYDLEHITTGVSPELAALCAKRGVIMRTYDEVKAQTTEVTPIVQKVETVKRSNVPNTIPIKTQKITPYSYSQPKVSTSTKKEPVGGFFGDLENTTVTPAEKKVTKGSISYFDQLITGESPASVVVFEQKEKKTFFNKLKESFFGFF